jgi:curved DNA-binding protein
MEFKDYYATLGVARDATQDVIKRSYRRLARKYHPDVSKEPEAEQRFKEVQEAYEVLKDPEKRAAYDRFGKDWKAGQEFRPPPGWDTGFEFQGGGGFGDEGIFSDFFESLFGRGRSGTGFRGEGFSARGQDHHAKVQIELADAFRGGVRSISLTMPETDAQGHLVTRTRTLNVRIPKGVTEGQRIRLAGQGSAGRGGGSKGDLFLEIMFASHPLFRAIGRDIHLELPITPWEAALGRSVTVPTLGGKVDLRIPSGSQSGRRLRLKGRGLPGDTPGDQIVELRIVTPAADTPAARAFYERMEQELPMQPRGAMGV